MRPKTVSDLLKALLAAATLAVAVPMFAEAAESGPAVVSPEPLPPGAAPPSLIRKVESRFSTFVGGT